MKTGIEIIQDERNRQILDLEFDSARDDKYVDGELAQAAACYAYPKTGSWPKSWSIDWWKPSPDNRIKELAKAGALIAAEIDRLQRLKSNTKLKEEGKYNVWDWIVTNDNRIVQITSDDMMDLPYGDIARHATDKEIEKGKIERLEDLEEIVEHILPRFEGIESHKSFKLGEDVFAAFCHSQLSGGIGMHIRNDYNLWDAQGKLHNYFKSVHKCKHPDDMSDLIIRHVYRAKNK